MIELTKAAYNRKYLVIGISIFMSIALISTGFAAWVMSSINAPSDMEAPVQVSVVQSGTVTITVDQWSKQDGERSETWHGSTLNFDAEPGDWSGRMRNSAPQTEENRTVGAQLLLPISGSITNPDTLDELKISFQLPESLTTAINRGYLSIDENAKAKLAGQTVAESTTTCQKNSQDATAINGTVLVTIPMDQDGPQTVAFEYVLKFQWGAYFAGMNPSLFYDDSEKQVTRGTNPALNYTGSAISNDQVTAEMEAFVAVMSQGMDEVRANEGTGQGALLSYSGVIEITVEGK